MDKHERGPRSIPSVSLPFGTVRCTRRNALISVYYRLLESGIMSDTQVHCGKSIWKVHKAILCVRSQWFKKALTGPFKVSACIYIQRKRLC